MECALDIEDRVGGLGPRPVDGTPRLNREASVIRAGYRQRDARRARSKFTLIFYFVTSLVLGLLYHKARFRVVGSQVSAPYTKVVSRIKHSLWLKLLSKVSSAVIICIC